MHSIFSYNIEYTEHDNEINNAHVFGTHALLETYVRTLSRNTLKKISRILKKEVNFRLA